MPVIPFPKDWLQRMVKALRDIRGERQKQIDEIFDEFGNAPSLAKLYIEPECQFANPADEDEQAPHELGTIRLPLREKLNLFFKEEERQIADGRNTLFILSDAGMDAAGARPLTKDGRPNNGTPTQPGP